MTRRGWPTGEIGTSRLLQAIHDRYRSTLEEVWHEEIADD